MTIQLLGIFSNGNNGNLGGDLMKIIVIVSYMGMLFCLTCTGNFHDLLNYYDLRFQWVSQPFSRTGCLLDVCYDSIGILLFVLISKILTYKNRSSVKSQSNSTYH